VDLEWLVSEGLREGGFPKGVGLAVVPDPNEGWRVVVAVASRRFIRPADAQRLAAVQKQLRKLYELARG
jgi:hypothetical protein